MEKKSYQEYIKGTKKVLENSLKEKEKYTIRMINKNFVVYPHVFSPKYFSDTEFFVKCIPFQEGEDFLEVGPGTGIISVFAALKGAKVTSVDINPEAVKNTAENASLHNVNVDVKEGDVYDPIGDQKFDTIFWNTPFGFVEEDELSSIEKALFDPGYKATKRFVFEAKSHLKPHGKLLIGFSTSLGKFDKLNGFLQEAGFSIKLLAKTESVETHPVFFELFEAKPSS